MGLRARWHETLRSRFLNRSMNTWILFVYAFLGWGASDNAIFMRDASRDPIWRNLIRQSGLFRSVWLLIGLLFLLIGILYVNNALFFFVLPLVVFTLALALTLGPVVVEERTKFSWEPLLTVPYEMKEILLGKASGALWHIRALTYAVAIALMCVSAGVGTVSLTLIPEDMARTGGWYRLGLCGALFIIPVLSSLLFILDRMQQYGLMAVAALASGATAPSIRGALSNAIAVVVLIWLAEIVITEAFLTLEQGGAWKPNFTSILSAATLGPVVSYISRMDLSHAALFVVGTLLLREVLISGLWRWTLNSARV